jgi:hypothetical protein
MHGGSHDQDHETAPYRNLPGIYRAQGRAAPFGHEEGDEVFVVRTEGGVELTRYDPEFERAIETSRKVLHRYPNAMKKLADGM